jgi:hypothetical protein
MKISTWDFEEYGNPPDKYRRLITGAAAAIGATEAVGFRVRGIYPELQVICHIRPDKADATLRQAAIDAFKDIVRNCLRSGEDGAFEIMEKLRRPEPQFCLVILAHRMEKIAGVAAFICRCENITAANSVLLRLQGKS